MSKKRAREAPGVDVSLVEVYEDLAHEDEEIRLKAAHSLLTKHLPQASQEHSKTILKRLLRGLCSGRKAARLGFSVALAECLSQLQQHEASLTPSEILDVLESSTIPESGTTGQDERDHYFGRLFGSDAIIKSKLLFNEAELPQWLRLLDIVCGISAKKPWLRQECGWILCNCVRQLGKENGHHQFIISIAEQLIHHKLIRTPEGLAIWITMKHQVGSHELPKAVWRHDNPLAKKDLQTLAQVLKDARGDSKSEADFESQGSATWSAQLHFAWDVVLAELFTAADKKNQVEFGDFWSVAVDEGLFAPSNSPERKHWGLQLLHKLVSSAPHEHLDKIFTKNATNCLMQSLKADNRYLQKGAQKVLRAIQARAREDPESTRYLLPALLQATNFIDFDLTTKTKTVEILLTSGTAKSSESVSEALKALLWLPGTQEEGEATNRRRVVVTLQMKLLNHATNLQYLDISRQILHDWIKVLKRDGKKDKLTPALSESTQLLVRQRLATAFEQTLKLGGEGRQLVLGCIELVRKWNLLADQEILDVLEVGWEKFKKHHKMARSSVRKNEKQDQNTAPQRKTNIHQDSHIQDEAEGAEGLALLYGLIIFQAYNNEPEAVSILEELIAFEEDSVQSAKSNHLKIENADGLVDILLSFASKPSKFLRRVTLDVFETFTSKLTRYGLGLLINVLQTKESKAGQDELFEAEGEMVEDDGSDDDGPAQSDLEMVDSDVELIDLEDVSTVDSTSDSDTESESTSASDSEDSPSDAADDELAALEKSLAEALGTRKLTTADLADDNGSSSDSDSDMDDDQMMTLDEKLTEVFRTRAAAQSQSKSRQKENKAAKENITNFKNRVLDMIEVYLKHESRNSNALDLPLPLLRLARETTTKQLATRAIDIVKALCTRCKGLQNLPILDTAELPSVSKSKKKKQTTDHSIHHTNGTISIEANDTTWALNILSSIHDEVCHPSSNAHKAACSQSSILLAKTLIKNSTDNEININAVVEVYARTQVRMLIDDKATVQEAFFRDWIGWCGSVRGNLLK